MCFVFILLVLMMLLVYFVAVLLSVEESDSDVASFFARQESIHAHLHLVKVLIDTEGMTIGVDLLLLVLTIADDCQFLDPIPSVWGLPLACDLGPIRAAFSVVCGPGLILRRHEHAFFFAFNDNHLWLETLPILRIHVEVAIKGDLKLC